MKNNVECIEIEFSKNGLNSYETKNISNYPVVYILKNDRSAYIGETTSINNRIKAHLKNSDRKKLKEAKIFYTEEFNQSATYNIETNLINYFIADEKYVLQNISQTKNKAMHNYYNKEYYDKKMFSEIWDILLSKNIVQNELQVLENKDIFKLSPFTSLSSEQYELKNEIIESCSEQIAYKEQSVFFVNGEAGSGKSVLLSSLFNTIQEMSNDDSSKLVNTNNYLLINHEEMMKTYKSISKSLPSIKKNQILKPTAFINKIDHADITLIDEGHLLLTNADPFNNFKADNQLEEIIKKSKITIIIYDPKQYLKMKSYWDKDMIKGLTREHLHKDFYLTEQFRMKASKEIINWVDRFVEGSILDLPDKDEHFDFRIFDDCSEMYNEIKLRNEEVGLSRMVSTFDYLHKKDGKDYYVEEGSFILPWNRGTNSNVAWAEREETINEVGSIYTIQGFDLNYVGVIIGPSVSVNLKEKIMNIDPSKYKDTGAFAFSNRFDSEEKINEVKEQIILNSINVLLKRGVKGLYIYFADRED